MISRNAGLVLWLLNENIIHGLLLLEQQGQELSKIVTVKAAAGRGNRVK